MSECPRKITFDVVLKNEYNLASGDGMGIVPSRAWPGWKIGKEKHSGREVGTC